MVGPARILKLSHRKTSTDATQAAPAGTETDEVTPEPEDRGCGAGASPQLTKPTGCDSHGAPQAPKVRGEDTRSVPEPKRRPLWWRRAIAAPPEPTSAGPRPAAAAARAPEQYSPRSREGDAVYLASLKSLRGLDPDLAREAAEDLGRAYRRRYGPPVRQPAQEIVLNSPPPAEPEHDGSGPPQ